MSDIVRFESSGDVAVLHFDDGKANVISPAALDDLNAALDQAEEAGQAVLLVGRPGRFSAGFDLSVMREGGPEAAREMVKGGARLALRIARFPAPVVLAVTGHALAMGGVLLLTADTRIGARGEFKIGFNEVAIGMAAPLFLLEFARERLSKRHFLRSVVQAEIYDPSGAVDAGFLDSTSEPDALFPTALAEAERLAKLPRGAYLRTRSMARSAALESIEETLDDDMKAAFPGS